MKLPKDFHLEPMNVLKITGLVLAAIILVVVAFRLIGSSFNVLLSNSGLRNLVSQKSAGVGLMEESYYDTSSMAYDKSAGGTAGLSLRNVASPSVPSAGDIVAGNDAEEFEVTEYGATVETRRLADTCQKIVDLKSRSDVIFENANEYEKSCNYTFKVKRDSVSEIIGVIESLNPKELNQNTYTIKNLVEDYTGEVEILEKKMASIEETLANAVAAYDDITILATRTQDVESLAKIIDSKINIIERLTQERINVNAQLERLQRAKSEQLDRLDYTYFNVYIFENKFVDPQDLKDSWKNEIKSFVRDVNKVAQDITINLAVVLLWALQYVLYFFIALVIVKYGWQLAKYIWKR
ncbi:MAG: hypothetical protein RB292_02040 [Patescibacteria group bacterium]|jgi:hypothetical protein|nr:hypothetical protein [Patescibacteria group bacterium]